MSYGGIEQQMRFCLSMKKWELGGSDEGDRVRKTRIVISYQSKRFSGIDWLDGSKMLVRFCDLKREFH